MDERLMAFIIWVIVGVLFIILGIYDMNSKKAKPFGFWANAAVGEIEDVKGYNRALGILWCVWCCFYIYRIPHINNRRVQYRLDYYSRCGWHAYQYWGYDSIYSRN